MTIKILRIVGIFALIFLPILALSFFAYTVLHQVVLIGGALIAAWVACRFNKVKTNEERLNREVFYHVYELKKSKEALDSCFAMSIQTKAYHERLLSSKLSEECSRVKRYHRALSCLLIQINSFSEFSQLHGSVFSEVLFQEATRFLKESIRQVDSLVRHGEERMVLILPETSLNQAAVVANRIRFAIEMKTFRIQNQHLKLTVSISFVCFDPAVFHGKEDMLAALEAELKKAGPNQVVGVSAQAG